MVPASCRAIARSTDSNGLAAFALPSRTTWSARTGVAVRGPMPRRPACAGEPRAQRRVDDRQSLVEGQVEAAVDDGPHRGRDAGAADLAGVQAAAVNRRDALRAVTELAVGWDRDVGQRRHGLDLPAPVQPACGATPRRSSDGSSTDRVRRGQRIERVTRVHEQARLDCGSDEAPRHGAPQLTPRAVPPRRCTAVTTSAVVRPRRGRGCAVGFEFIARD